MNQKKLIKSKNQNLKSRNLVKSSNSKTKKESKFLTFKVKETFNHLKQTFIKVSIIQQFYLEYHVQIKTNASDYVIKEVLSQLILEFDI